MKRAGRRGGIVLLFVKPLHKAQREKTSGVYAAATRRGWQILPIEDEADPARVRHAVAAWRAIGCIVDKSAMPDRTRMAKSALGGVPTVFMGSDSRRRTQVFDRSVQDGGSAVAAAVDELARSSPSSWAFVGEPGAPSWSVERCSAFKSAVAGKGECSEYTGPSPATPTGNRRLAKWLGERSAPCAVMLAADHLAHHVYEAAARAGLSIPGDLSVIGVNNDDEICENLNPPLSSVQLDYLRAGKNAVELLERRLKAPLAPPMTMIYRATGVARRLSSRKPQRSWRVTDALAFIARHATDGASAKDVVAYMGCCRRLAETSFRESCGMSIMDAIHEVRLEKAFMLLRKASFPIDAIPGACGYSSNAFFKTLFRRKTGMTMRDWRNANADLTSPQRRSWRC